MDFTFTPYKPDMTFTELPYKVFDCDFHFYEMADSFTRYLPKPYQGLVRLANIDGRTKMIIRDRVSDYIPNPTFEVVAEPASGFATSRVATPRARASGTS